MAPECRLVDSSCRRPGRGCCCGVDSAVAPARCGDIPVSFSVCCIGADKSGCLGVGRERGGCSGGAPTGRSPRCVVYSPVRDRLGDGGRRGAWGPPGDRGAAGLVLVSSSWGRPTRTGGVCCICDKGGKGHVSALAKGRGLRRGVWLPLWRRWREHSEMGRRIPAMAGPVVVCWQI